MKAAEGLCYASPVPSCQAMGAGKLQGAVEIPLSTRGVAVVHGGKWEAEKKRRRGLGVGQAPRRMGMDRRPKWSSAHSGVGGLSQCTVAHQCKQHVTLATGTDNMVHANEINQSIER